MSKTEPMAAGPGRLVYPSASSLALGGREVPPPDDAREPASAPLAVELALRGAPLRVLSIASEGVPYVKTGGLADVIGALPHALTRLGHDVHVILPRYKAIDADRWHLRVAAAGLPVPINQETEA